MYSFFRFYILSSLHVGLALFAFTQVTALQLGTPFPTATLFAIFGLTVVGYNCIKFGWKLQLLKSSLALSIKGITALGLIALIGFLPMTLEGAMWLVIVMILSVAYGIPQLNLQFQLRQLKGLKILLVALVWVITSLFLPISYFEGEFFNVPIAMVLSHFLFVVVATLPFEIRDLDRDATELGTWPQLLGVGTTQLLGYGLLFLFLLLEYSYLPDFGQFVISAIIAVLTALFLAFSSERQSEFYSSFWVESLPIIWWLLLWAYQSCSA